MKKKIVIMTASAKNGGLCVAGIDITDPQSETYRSWIRVVTEDDDCTGAVPYNDMICSNRQTAEVLDIVNIDFARHVPNDAQRENWLYNPNIKWEKVGTTTLEDVLRMRGTDQYHGDIFGNNSYKVMPQELTGESLTLLKISNVNKLVEPDRNNPDMKKVRIHFSCGGNNYKFFRVGDLYVLEKFANMDCRTHLLQGEYYAIFSLTNVWLDGKHYKMLAQLFDNI